MPPHITDQPFDLAFVVALAGPTEFVFEQVMALQGREHPAALALPVTQDLRHSKFGVVI